MDFTTKQYYLAYGNNRDTSQYICVFDTLQDLLNNPDLVDTLGFEFSDELMKYSDAQISQGSIILTDDSFIYIKLATHAEVLNLVFYITGATFNSPQEIDPDLISNTMMRLPDMEPLCRNILIQNLIYDARIRIMHLDGTTSFQDKGEKKEKKQVSLKEFTLDMLDIMAQALSEVSDIQTTETKVTLEASGKAADALELFRDVFESLFSTMATKKTSVEIKRVSSTSSEKLS